MNLLWTPCILQTESLNGVLLGESGVCLWGESVSDELWGISSHTLPQNMLVDMMQRKSLKYQVL